MKGRAESGTRCVFYFISVEKRIFIPVQHKKTHFTGSGNYARHTRHADAREEKNKNNQAKVER